MLPKRILFTIAMLALAAMVAAPTLAARPGDRSATIQVTFDFTDPTNQTFIGSGSGVCSSGWADGEVVTFLESGEKFKIRLTKWLHCDDGTGDFQIMLSAGGPLGSPTTSGGWVIIDGSGDYSTAVGGGTMSAKLRAPNDVLGVDTMTGTITK